MFYLASEGVVMSELSPIVSQFRQARRVSVPLVAINTPDSTATMRALMWSLLDAKKVAAETTKNALDLLDFPLLKWDAGHGLVAINEKGLADHANLTNGGTKQNTSINPAEALRMLENLSPDGIVFFYSAHRFINNDFVAQGIANLRDRYKMNGRMLVLLSCGITLPADLSNDVIVFDEPLPSPAQLESIVKDQHAHAKLSAPDDETLGKAVEAVQGLAAFTAEQVVALSMTPKGVNLDRLWERKRQIIDDTPGLTIWRGGERFSDIGGLTGIKQFFQQVIKGKEAPRCIVVLDEIEKHVASSAGNTQQTSEIGKGIMGNLLSYMQDHQAAGALLVGVPGCSKTLLAKATASEAGIPAIQLNLGRLKASLLGETERQVEQALNIISAISQDRTLFIATSNDISGLPGELIRRFSLGTWYADLPTEEEARLIWAIYFRKYNIPESYDLPESSNWSGDEISRCARLSWKLNISLKDAAEKIIPIATSQKDRIEKLRNEAHSTYLSVLTGKVYQRTQKADSSFMPDRKFKDAA
jgi:hypothetical protein